MARKFGIPVFSSTRAAGRPGSRRSLRTLARAAVFLVLAALAALVLRGYVQHRRMVRAEEPIGVPIGVADASASATPAKLSAADAIAANTLPSTTTLPDSNKTEPASAKVAEADKGNAPAPETNSLESAATNKVAVAPAPPAAASPSTPQAQEPASIAANTSTQPATTGSSEVTVAAQVELPPATAKSRPVESDAVAAQTTPKKIIMREVRRGELVEEPELRRAEPPPPEEGPENSLSETTASSSEQSNSVTKTEQSHDVEAEKSTAPPPSVKQSDSKPKVAAKPRAKKTAESAKSKRQAAPKLYLPQPLDETDGRKSLPPGMARARFVGVTPEGDWMLELPSNKIVIVPPPPSHR